jgi:ubiquitin-activating enzyme E1
MDNERYSRQSYTIGQDVMLKLSQSKILIIGYSTVSLDIIRNLALLGINTIDIHHDFNLNKLERYQKTGLYYESDKIPLDELRNLNPTISINLINILDEDNEICAKIIKKYNLLILVNSSFEDGINFNRITHKFNIPMIVVGNYGLLSYIFNDFGENFTINDIDGEIYENLIIEEINDKIIKFKDPHKLGDKDVLIITYTDDTSVEHVVKRTKTPFLIELLESSKQDVNDYKNIIKKKITMNMSFKPLKQCLSNIEYVTSDFSLPENRIKDLHFLHKILNKYFESFKTTPRSWNLVDYEIFTNLIENYDSKSTEFKNLTKKFCFTARGTLLPIVSIISGLACQEVLKALGKKYTPIKQWYYLDSFDLIADNELEFDGYQNTNYKSKNKYEGAVNILGKDLLTKIQKTKSFVIGAGAIGCELIKLLGMLGLKNIYLTDMDSIEKSNLSRQFLFNDNDIHKSKSKTAASKIKLLNKDCDVIPFENKVCPDTENIFDDAFFSNIDIILNALDNIEARLYVDQQAIKYLKPLIDSGTLGTKGNVQVVIPHMTESYGSQKDPDEKNGIPICTIKSFPYKPEHTIQWSRELFEQEFSLIPTYIKKFQNDDGNEFRKLNESDIKIMIKLLYKYNNFRLCEESFTDILIHIFYENYIYSINELLEKHKDDKDITGKNLPSIFNFDDLRYLYEDFMFCGFQLLNQIFNTSFVCDVSLIRTRTTILDINYTQIMDKYDINFIRDVISLLKDIKVNSLEFDKDNDDLKHVDMIVLLSNMRNKQYNINQVDKYTTRKISGNIIPALITTTAIVAGFQILEFIKLVKYYKSTADNLDIYKNRFVNTSINYCDGITPYTPKYTILNNKKLSLWDRFIVNTLVTSDMIREIENFTQAKLEYLTQANEVIYDGDTILKENIGSKNNIMALIGEEFILPIYVA